MTPKDKEFGIDLSDEVVRGAIVSQDGEVLPPAPRPAPPPAPAKPATPEATVEVKELTPWEKTTREVAALSAGLGGVVGLGKLTSPLFMSNAFTFGLASLIGYRVVWGVAPALHSPLMSVTNAISGMVGLGGLFILGGGYLPATIPQTFGALSVLLAFVNVGGGFVVTKRMLDMFKSMYFLAKFLVFNSQFVADDTIQDQLILPSTHGCTPSQLLSSVVASSPQPALEPKVLFKPAILPAQFSVCHPSPDLHHRRLQGSVTCWACSVLEPVFLPVSLPPDFPPKS
jgi:hypothetical protein